METVLEARKLTIGYRQGHHREKCVQRELDFSLEAGSLVCLLGPNGAGKSTLLRTLSGMQPALSGELFMQGRSLSAYSERERSRSIGLVLTDKIFAGGLRVRELVALGRHPYVGFFGRLSEEDHRIVEEAIHQTGIEAKADSYMAELSDGERQKVMIAKALAQQCPLILLDEPTAYLDVTSRIEIMHLLHRLARQGKSILLSTHDIEQALLLSDRLWLLSSSLGMLCGVTEDLVLQGQMSRFFGRGGVTFDVRDGAFRLENASLRPLKVEAPAEMMRWVQNALMRSGFRAVSTETEPTSDLFLRVVSPTDMELNCAGKRITVGSFADLIDRLKLYVHA